MGLLSAVRLSKYKLPPEKDEVWLNDGDNLRLRVRRPDQMLWFYRGRFNGGIIQYSLGVYPLVTLEKARGLRDTCKTCIKEGVHPKDHFAKLKEKNLLASDDLYRFSTLFEDLIYHNTHITDKKWSHRHIVRYRGIWNNYLARHLKDKSILVTSDIDLLNACRQIKTKPVAFVSGKTDIARWNRTTTAIYAKTLLSLIYKFAKQERQYKGANQVLQIADNSIFKKDMKKVKHHASVNEEDLGMYWNSIKNLPILQDNVFMTILTSTALRVGSLATAKWSWFNHAKKTITIPPEHMKGREQFITPLPDMAVKLLDELKKINKPDKDDYIFNNRFGEHYSLDRPRLLIQKTMGLKYATAHGVRTILKLNLERSMKFNNLAIEAQLDHDLPNKVEMSYMADYDWLKERFEIVEYMVQMLDTHETQFLTLKNINKNTATV